MSKELKDKVTGIVGENSKKLWGTNTSLTIWFLNRPASLFLRLDTPFIYIIIDVLISSYLEGKAIRCKVVGNEIIWVKEIEELQCNPKELLREIKKSLLWMDSFEIDFPNKWDEYKLLSETKKHIFWKRLIIRRMKWLEWLGYDPYLLFTPEVIAVWKSREKDIGTFINQVVKTRGLDSKKINFSNLFN